MKCPYCVSTIDDQALACPHCTRDLFLLKPLLERLRLVEAELERAHLRLASLEVAQPADAAPAQIAEPVPVPAPEPLPAWALLVPALAMLLAAHYVIVVALDLHTVWLRIASLLIPLPFGYQLMRRARCGPLIGVALVALVAFAAVIGMSAAIALVDGTPVLPAGTQQWREFLSYAASIFLSFVTGMIVGRSRDSRAAVGLRRHPLVIGLMRVVAGATRNPAAIQVRLEGLRSLIVTLAATATAVASVTSGLHGIIGK
jgi:hypothetical protein